MNCICEKKLENARESADGHQTVKTRQVENEQQAMMLELLELLFEQGDIKEDELQRAKYILYSENVR